LDVEASVISALAKSSVPIPGLLFYETDRSALGAPFLVLGFVAGRAASDDPPFTVTGWVADLDAAARRSVAEGGLEAIAAIHAFDWRTGGLADLDRSGDGRSPLRVVVDDIREFYATTSTNLTNPTVEAGLDWLEAHWPQTESEPVLTWGDARLGNLLYGDDLAVNAVLDWEMVTIGPRELDLGWWTFLLRHHTDGIGVPLPTGLPTPEESVTYYADLTGHQLTEFLFYEVLAGVRLSILTQRAASLLIDAGILPPNAPMLLANPATNLVAELAGLPSPGGEKASPMNRGA
jgi:aminoglycoside phosphotransferase (APT) family kinase protein